MLQREIEKPRKKISALVMLGEHFLKVGCRERYQDSRTGSPGYAIIPKRKGNQLVETQCHINPAGMIATIAQEKIATALP